MISIAMTTYNGERFLREQLDSILNQTYKDIELVVCDDCSADSTWSILQEYQQKDNRIRCYKNEKNLGFKKNFEKAISLCNGEFIALSDQDDIWTDNHLEVLFQNIQEKDLICGNNELINLEGKSLHIDFFTSNQFSIKKFPTNEQILYKILLSGNCFQGASMLFSKRFKNIAFPIPEKLNYHDSWLACLACTLNSFAVINHIITYYRQHNSQVTKNIDENFYENKIKYIDSIENFASFTLKLKLKKIEKYFSINKQNIFFFADNYKYIHPDQNFNKLLIRYIKYKWKR